MSVHLMMWNPTSKEGGRDGNLSLATLIVTIINICNYQKNYSITRHDLLLSKYGQL